MTRVVVTKRENEVREIDGADGLSVMEAIRDAGIGLRITIATED